MSQPSLANKIRLLRLSGEEQRMVLENHLTGVMHVLYLEWKIRKSAWQH